MARKRRLQGSTVPTASYLAQRARQRSKLTAWWIGLGVLGLVVLIGAALLLFRPSSALPQEVSAAQAFAEYQKGALFVDVRSGAEWTQGHIANSVLIPLDALPTRLGELPHDRDIVVICRSGQRSREGAAILRQAGFTRVTSLSGGLESWVAAGYPFGK